MSIEKLIAENTESNNALTATMRELIDVIEANAGTITTSKTVTLDNKSITEEVTTPANNAEEEEEVNTELNDDVPPPPSDEEEEEEVTTASDRPKDLPRPEPHLRPFPSPKPKRKARQQTALEKAIEGGDEAEIEEAETALLKYQLGVAERNLKRLNNVEATGAKEAQDLQLAIEYASADVADITAELSGAEPQTKTNTPDAPKVDGGTPPPPPSDAPAPPAPPAPEEEPIVEVDTRGCPDGYTLSELADDDYVYQSYIGSGWSNQQMIDQGIMIEIVHAYTLQDMRDELMNQSKTKDSAQLVAQIGKFALSMEEVDPADYPALLQALRDVPVKEA